MSIIKYIAVAIAAYLIGNFSTGIVISKTISHMDIRAHGSGNAGATNMLRTLGWVPSLLTLAGDTLKSVLATLMGKWIGGEAGMLLAGVCVIVGHNWPVFLGFRGGKGVATTLGFMLVTSPLTALILTVIELSIIALTRFVSLGSIIAAALYPVITAYLFTGNAHRIAAAVVVAALVLFSHRANIARLIKGNENRLDFRKIREISRKKGEDNK